jgi:hypothetical protein
MTPELQQAALVAMAQLSLLREWYYANTHRFDGLLRPPLLEVVPLGRRLGAWDGRSGTLSLDRDMVLGQPWGVVIGVLLHEMAHQYCDRHLGMPAEQHGATFRQVCLDRGIDPSAAGLPSEAAGEAEPAVLRRIQKLLALAESPELHEAEAAMAMAQRLMREYNVQIVNEDRARRFSTRQVGPGMVRMPLYMKLLGSLLSEHFFVYVILVTGLDMRKEGQEVRSLEVTGTPENLDMATYVYDFMIHTGERLWQELRRSRGLKGELERQRFFAGLVSGFAEKLRLERVRVEETGLVWVADPRLNDWVDRRYPHRRSSRSTGAARTEAYDAGRAAGKDLVLNRPIEGAAAARGRALTGPTGR